MSVRTILDAQHPSAESGSLAVSARPGVVANLPSLKEECSEPSIATLDRARIEACTDSSRVEMSTKLRIRGRRELQFAELFPRPGQPSRARSVRDSSAEQV